MGEASRRRAGRVLASALRFGIAALVCLLCLACLVGLASGTARAELKVDGRWRQGALREDFTVQQWLNGCGPAPQSNTSGGGEIVNIRPEGDELTFVGGGRVYRTNQCYDPMPSLIRETHSRDASGKTWRTRCTTPPNDPRKAILNTLVVATTDAHIEVIETGRYEITLENGRCMADVKRTRTFDLVQDEPTPTPTASETPSPTPTAAPTATPTAPTDDPKPSPTCAAPGPPSRLEVRPSKKLLRTGEKFKFRASVLDERGCSTRTATTWKLSEGSEGKGVSVDATGNVTVTAEASEGNVELVAAAGGKETRVIVEVTQPAHYDELLARSGLNASGENDSASVVAIGGQSLGAGEGRVEDRAKSRRFLFLAIVGAVLAILAALAVVVLRRSRRAKALELEAEERHENRVREAVERRRQREAEHAAQMRAHEESVAARAAAERAAAARAEARRRPPQPDVTAPPVAPAPTPAPAKRGKICPTCGERFEGGAEFCGKDGTQLVLLN